MKERHVINFSGGKDSTAMLLRMIELGMQVDEIVFADTGAEFPELYEYIKRVEKYIGREVTIVKPKRTFKETFFLEIGSGKSEGNIRGFPMKVFPCWWTRDAKIRPLDKASKDATHVYIGIAADEAQRMTKDKTKIGKYKYPLIEWGWTEQDCIDYLNKINLFNPLYVNFNRLGCWFCPKQSTGSLFVLWKNYPELWKEFKEWEKISYKETGRLIRIDKSLDEIEKSFEKGKIPKTTAKYECYQGCEGVKHAFIEMEEKGADIPDIDLGCF
jgi:3'-phosphoadenosine 5'-phosphosulfate sulfotransferase (PAPS reductase)/FAD synthetase